MVIAQPERPNELALEYTHRVSRIGFDFAGILGFGFVCIAPVYPQELLRRRLNA